MKTIIHPCKFCGLPATARFPLHAPEEAVNKWLPLLAHDRCSDLRIKKRESLDAIFDTCFSMARGLIKDKDKARRILEIQTRRYAESMQAIRGSGQVMWSEDFPRLLMDHPSKCAKIIYEYNQEQLK